MDNQKELDIFSSNLPEENLQDLYLQTILQIAKDFHPHYQMNPPSEKIHPNWIFEETRRMLTAIIHKSSNSLNAIIYRVDISENQLSKAMKGLDDTQKIDKLTTMIVRREVQKVWLRKKFSE